MEDKWTLGWDGNDPPQPSPPLTSNSNLPYLASTLTPPEPCLPLSQRNKKDNKSTTPSGFDPHDPYRSARRRIEYSKACLGSICHIILEHPRKALYVVPLCWTDTHAQLLGIKFYQQAPITTPVPIRTDTTIEPSKLASALTFQLNKVIRLRHQRVDCDQKIRAMKFVMRTLFPDIMSRPKSNNEFDIHFGALAFKRTVPVPLLWKKAKTTSAPTEFDSPFTSFDSAATVAASTSDRDGDASTSAGRRNHCSSVSQVRTTLRSNNQPIVAYLSRSQLAKMRRKQFRAHMAPNRQPNYPVIQLQDARARNLRPANRDEDAYMAAVFLAIAQHGNYRDTAAKPQITSVFDMPLLPVREFYDAKVHVMVADEDTENNIIVYTANVSATFLQRFHYPSRDPTKFHGAYGLPDGMDINYVKVAVWPLLGLKERLAKALGPHIAGDTIFTADDPHAIEMWDCPFWRPMLSPPGVLKRTRSGTQARDDDIDTDPNGGDHDDGRSERRTHLLSPSHAPQRPPTCDLQARVGHRERSHASHSASKRQRMQKDSIFCSRSMD